MKSICLKFLCMYIGVMTITSCFSKKNDESTVSEDSGIVIANCDEETVRDLAIVCKIWGFMKFYHPEISMGNYNMDHELFQLIPLVLNADSKEKRNDILYKWVSGFGKVTPSNTDYAFSPDQIKIYPDLDWLEDNFDLGEKLSRRLQDIKNAERNSDTTNYVVFPYGPSAFLWKEDVYGEYDSYDTGYRLVGLFRLWNAVQYYFAYKYLIEKDWNAVLMEFIPQFINTDGKLGYKLAVLKLLTCLEDSHARILSPEGGSDATKIHPDIAKWEGEFMLPFEVTFIEEKAVITDFYSVKNEDKSDYPFRIGDVILSINHEPVDSIIRRKLVYTPASHYAGKLKKIATSVLRSDNNRISVSYERGNELLSGEYNAYPVSDIHIPNRTRKDLPAYTHMDNGIGYIYLGSTRGETLPEQFGSDTKGLIIDLRSFPNSIKNYWGYYPLFPDMVMYANLTVPSISHPGLFTYSEGARAGKKNPDYFKGKKVLLINEYAQSQPEFLAMQYGCVPNTTLIGSKTTGADGNVSVIGLPGMDIMFTGVGVYYPDGRETQRIGILPDIEVKPTIEGVREGRDEVLEKAISFILEGSPG